MKLKTLVKTLFLSATLVACAHAQMLGGLTVSPPSAKVGEPVTVTANIDVISANYCGFIVFFGDGTSVDGVVDLNKPPPFVVSHTYTKAGQYTLNLGGRSVQSHPNCGGADKSATVTIVEAPKPVAAAPAAPAVAPRAEPAKPVAAAKEPAIAAVATAATVCSGSWKLVPKSFVKKTGAYTCSAKAGTELPSPKAACPGDLTYFENAKKGQFGCRP